MRIPLLNERPRQAKPTFNPEDIMLRADALYRAEQSTDLRSVIASKLEDLRQYDVLAMDRVVAILMWGRSGSLLLSSYLDGHEDVIMLPELYGLRMHDFFERYQSLTLRDKLLAYPAFDTGYTRFFDGDFAISSAQYHAAVEAIVEFYSKCPQEFLESRRAFFLFVHIAYNLALGRLPASSTPLIVYAQHWWDSRMARHLVEDFPQTKFVHTIRDPISSCDSYFHYHLDPLTDLLPHWTLHCLTDRDRPQFGMESRTRAVRFEDLHSDTAETIRDLSDWVGLPFRETLLDSTFNGIPYVIRRDGIAWSGRRLQQVQRRSQHLSLLDRALMFTLFYENFVDWNYECPKIFGQAIVRCFVFFSLVLVPTKMEITAARAIFKRTILPSIRHGNISLMTKSLLRIGFCRLRIIWLLAPVFFQRCAHRPTLLQVDHKSRPLERRDVVTEGAARNETNYGGS